MEFGLQRNVDPMQALLDEVRRTSGLILFYEERVRELDENAIVLPVGGEGTSDQGITYHPAYKGHVLIELHREERKHLVQVAKACIDAGIAERQIELAEQQGQLVAGVIRAILGDLGVDLNAKKTRKVVRSRLLEVAAIDVNGVEVNGG